MSTEQDKHNVVRRFQQYEGDDQLDLFPKPPQNNPPWFKWLVLAIVLAALSFIFVPAHADDLGFTIGKQAVITSGFACDTAESAIAVADALNTVGESAFDDPTVKPLMGTICGQRNGQFVVTPIAVLHEAGDFRVLQVNVWFADGDITSYMVVTNAIHAAGIAI